MNNDKFLVSWKKGDEGFIDQHCIHFQKSEFECKCNKDHEQIIDIRLVQGLEYIRGLVKKPIKINSGYRCGAHNATVKNADPKSKHIYGIAADIVIPGFDVRRYLKIMAILKGKGFNGFGIFLYEGSRMHIDLRPESECYLGTALW